MVNGSDVIAIGEGNEFNGVPVPIYKSTNGGIDWVKKNQSVSTVYDRVKDAYFKNGTEGIGVGSNGFSKIFIIKTSDGGENWSTSTVDTLLVCKPYPVSVTSYLHWVRHTP
jgi:photosystem II stability/assembly factor-like uncharacterized protein